MLEFLKIMLEGKKSEMDERGATAVEYGLLVALIAAVIVTVVVTRWRAPLSRGQTSRQVHRAPDDARPNLPLSGGPRHPEGNTMLEFLKIMLDGKTAEMDERGATAVEYGLLVALIAAVIVDRRAHPGPRSRTASTVNNAV